MGCDRLLAELSDCSHFLCVRLAVQKLQTQSIQAPALGLVVDIVQQNACGQFVDP